MGTCVDCQQWDPKENYYNERKPVGFGLCGSPKWSAGYHPDALTPDQILIENDEGWGCFTGPQFGCVHYTAKEVGH